MSDDEPDLTPENREHVHEGVNCSCGLPPLPDNVMAQIVFERSGLVRAARNGVSRRYIAYALRLLAEEYEREQAVADAETKALEELLNKPANPPEEPNP